ncbi:MAG TPA: class I SAM-dependent methyltransferase [Dehalococcoidia bacterium]|nr:class I SAM-dependent methyltransferase [Dehalococcoidia bacterium]
MAGSDSPTPEELKDQQRQGWANIAAAWRKWAPEMVAQGRAATELILREAHVRPGQRVLDLASGAGDPALTLAEAVAPDGHVTATDLTPEMLSGLAETARARGLANVSTQPADIEALPFPDAYFDVVTCRFGIMFCPDVGQACREIRRVLRPGGRAVLLVWGSSDQPFFASTRGVVGRHMHLPTPPPGAPTPWRFAEEGSISTALREAGFGEVREQLHTVSWPFPGSPERAWTALREITGMEIPADILDKVGADVVAALGQYYDGHQVDPTAQVIVASGVR